MTDEEWEAIRPLAEAKAWAQRELNAYRFSNTPADPRLYIEQQAQGVRLHMEYDTACRALDAAIAKATTP